MTEVATEEGMLGKYRILGTLGRGSMGVVYKAEDPSIGRIVAIKTLRKIGSSKFQDAESALERFKTEARSAGRLRHPNIITIFDASINDDTPYIVMDYVEGSSLDSIIHSEGRISPKRALHFLSQLADALDEAHKHGVIHRDVKPSNLVVDSTDRLYVLDFGVAKLNETIQEEMTEESKEPVMGTPAYMSPEQILNRTLKSQSDIFSFSLVAFEVLSGSRPFPGETFNEVVNSILHSSPIPITSLVPDFPLQLEVEFEHALAKNPEERPETAAEVVRVLTQALDLGSGVGSGRVARTAMGGGARVRKPSEWKSIGTLPPREERRDSSGEEVRVDSTSQVSPQEPEKSANDPSSRELVSLEKETREDNREREERSARIQGKKPDVEFSPPGSAPGDVFNEDHVSGLKQSVRFRREFSVLKTLMLIMGVFLISLSSYVFYMILKGNNPLAQIGIFKKPSKPAPSADGLPGSSRGDILDGKVESIDITKIPTKLDSEAEVTALSELSDRQVLAVLASEDVEVARKLDALEEAKSRKLAAVARLADKLLSHESYIVRIEVAKCLGVLGNRDAAPILLEHLSDHDPYVRVEIARAIGELGSSRSVGYLKRFYASEEDPKVREAIQGAVEEITGLPMKKAL